MSNEPIIKNAGTFNGYHVTTEAVSKRIFVKTTKYVNGEEKETSIPIRISRKNVILTRDGGDRVVLSAYIHRGQMYHRDSREKSGRQTDTHVVSEMGRMLKITHHEARNLLSLAA